MPDIIKDEVFKDAEKPVVDFKFDKSVATVFDDMVVRSVPFYIEIQRMMAELTKDFAIENTNVYDLGCSTGTTMINLDKTLSESIHFVGVDNSDEMLKKCKENLQHAGVTRQVTLENQNVDRDIKLYNPSVVIFCLTLQFVRPLNREKILQRIYDQLPENGALILIEKILTENTSFNRLFIDHYYDFKKRNGYDEVEISKKREALENVLIPYKLSENEEMLLYAGFRSVETFFKWYNFTGLIAIK